MQVAQNQTFEKCLMRGRQKSCWHNVGSHKKVFECHAPNCFSCVSSFCIFLQILIGGQTCPTIFAFRSFQVAYQIIKVFGYLAGYMEIIGINFWQRSLAPQLGHVFGPTNT